MRRMTISMLIEIKMVLRTVEDADGTKHCPPGLMSGQGAVACYATTPRSKRISNS